MALFILYLSIDSMLNSRMSEDLREDIAEFAMLFRSEGITRVMREIDREAMPINADQVFLRLLDDKGNQIFSSDLSHWKGVTENENTLKLIAASRSAPVLETAKFPDQEYDTRIVYGFIGPQTILQIGESLEEKAEIMELLLSVFVVMFCIVIPFASVVGWFMARQAVQGIEEVSRAAVDIESGNLDRRVSIKSKGDEIQKLADTFNAMAKRIRSLISEMQEMTDNIAHDLRSPLARIRAISEATLSRTDAEKEYKTAAADTIEECDRLIQLINTTLDVAEVEAGVTNTTKEEVNISKLTEDVCEFFEPASEERGIDLSLKIEADCRLHGDKQSLQRMLANLLDNALKYTQPPGKVSIEVKSDAKVISIAIADTGIGIPLSDQHRVFERFFRCDQSRTKEGCGLGLSYSRAVARAHGGEITLSSAPSEGSTFIIILPVSTDPLVL